MERKVRTYYVDADGDLCCSQCGKIPVPKEQTRQRDTFIMQLLRQHHE